MKVNRPHQTNLICVFIRAHHQAQIEKLNGIYAAAIKRGRQVVVVDDTCTPERFRTAIGTYRPLGCIVDATAVPDDGFGSLVGEGFHTVVLQAMERKEDCKRFDSYRINERIVATTALRKFRDLGLRHFGFVGEKNPPFWSKRRERHFATASRSWDLSRYRHPDDEKSTIDTMSDWLKALPNPSGVFLAADHLATLLYLAANKAKLEIGKDLFVIGVDNDERICNSLTPTLSSVHPNFFKCGYESVYLLEERILHPRAARKHPQYGLVGFISRASTARPFSDSRIRNGRAFIEEHGCERIDANSVANVMRCSRRTAEMLFRKHTDGSILDAIRTVRIEKAKTLLVNTVLPIDAIPPMCGYHSLPQMKVFFKKVTGKTMREWRTSHGSSKGTTSGGPKRRT